MITDEQIAEWKRLADAATSGPWKHDDSYSDRVCNGLCGDQFEYSEGSLTGLIERHGNCSTVSNVEERRDVAFIAAARTAVPALIAEVELLRHEVSVLKQYGDAQADRTREEIAEVERLRREVASWQHSGFERQLDEARAEVGTLTERVGQMTVARDVIADLAKDERIAMLAEVGTLRARVAELEAGPQGRRCRCGAEIGDNGDCEAHPSCDACGEDKAAFGATCAKCDGFGATPVHVPGVHAPDCDSTTCRGACCKGGQ
jgi:hypothetical protein